MKSRETLIRLKRFHVDEKRRQVAQIETMIAEFGRMAADLDREIAVEQERAGITDPAHFAYPTYAKAVHQPAATTSCARAAISSSSSTMPAPRSRKPSTN